MDSFIAMQTRSDRISRVAAGWMMMGEWMAHPGRVIIAGLAIAIGVSLGFAVHLINASALNEFDRAVRTVNGDADLQVRAVSPLGFDEALYPKLARVQGVQGASPVVEVAAVGEAGTDVSLMLVGVDVLRAAQVTPSLVGRRVGSANERAAGGEPVGVQPGDFFNATTLFLSEAALRATKKHIGDTIALRAGEQANAFVIAGTLPGISEDQSLGVIDIAAAQWRFGRLGRLQRIDLRLADHADPARLITAIAAILPSDAQIVNRESEARRTDNLSRAYRVNLDMLALVALLTGAFLVYSAQSLSVARRRPQFALLRVIGLERRGLLAQVLAEGALLGGIGSLAGLALGLLLADIALRFFGGDLGGGYFRGTQPELVFTPMAGLGFLLLGLAAALVGSLLPALEAARAQPAIALKNGGDAGNPKRIPAWRLALGLLTAGALAAFLPAVGGMAVFGYVSIGLLLFGGVAAMPLVARLMLAPMQRLAVGVPALDLSLKRLWGAPSQAAIALCGIVASTSLMIAMAVMVTSFRGSVDDWLTEILPADVYLRVEGDDSGIEAELQRRLAEVKGVAAIDFRKLTPLRLSAERPSIALLARTIDRSDPKKSLPMIGASRPIPAGATPVWLSEPAVLLYGYRPGDWMTLPIGNAKVFVAGMWRDYARQQGAIAIDSADYTQLTGDTLRTDGAVTLAPGVEARAASDAMRAVLPAFLAERVTFAEPRELRAQSLRIFDRSFAVTYVLEAIAILVGLAGVAATFSAQILARTKEFGMLRHVGVSRRQIVVMLLGEGALLGAVGVAAGIGLGLAMSQVLIHVVNPQSFHWTMETRLPLSLFAVVTAALIMAAAATALIAGRRALSTEAVRAVKEDW